jgi:peroxiredoxin
MSIHLRTVFKINLRGFAFTGALVLAAELIGGTGIAQEAKARLDPAAQKELKTGQDALAARRYADAEKAFRKANKIQHESCLPCYVGLAQALASLSKKNDALRAADKAMQLATNDAGRAQVHSLRGFALASGSPDAKTLKEEEAEYRQASQLDPAQPEYHLRLGMTLMKESQDEEGKKEIGQFLQLDPRGRYAEYAHKLMENPRRAREDYAPEFAVTTLQGETVSLNGLTGKFVVLDFWATWCPPCRSSVGELKELTRKYPRDRVVLISVSVDKEEDKWREFVAKKEMDWHQYRDPEGTIQRTFGIHAFPTYIVIDPEGIIRQRIVGENPQQSIVARLKSVLATLTADKGKA